MHFQYKYNILNIINLLRNKFNKKFYSDNPREKGDFLIWGIIIGVIILFIGYHINNILSRLFYFLVGGLSIYCLIEDNKIWEQQRIKIYNEWWQLIPPIYLWKRSNILKESKKYFWTLMIIILVNIYPFAYFTNNNFNEKESIHKNHINLSQNEEVAKSDNPIHDNHSKENKNTYGNWADEMKRNMDEVDKSLNELENMFKN